MARWRVNRFPALLCGQYAPLTSQKTIVFDGRDCEGEFITFIAIRPIIFVVVFVVVVDVALLLVLSTSFPQSLLPRFQEVLM